MFEQKQGDDGGKDIMKKHRRQVLFSGIITAVGISNLPFLVFVYFRMEAPGLQWD